MNIISCQEKNQEEMLKKFVIDLFNEKVSAKSVIDKYLEILPDKRNSLSIIERKKTAIGIIKKTRKNEGYENTWLIPNNKIKNISHPVIYPFDKHSNLSKIKISGIEKIKNRVYILLDKDKKKILQYYLINEKGTKIISFNLLVKSENLGWFFLY